MVRIFAFALIVLAPTAAFSETVCVKYGPCPLNLSAFDCTNTPRSSFIRRVCYDASNRFMAINLKGTWYPYCEIDAGTVQGLLSAESAGRYYLASMALSLIALKQTGARFAPHILFMPAYWLLISFAAYRAVFQLLTRPFHWEKTEHGVSRFGRGAAEGPG